MKKRITKVLIFVLVGCLLLSGGHALASDISGALYYAIIAIGNSGGDDATNVCTTANISTPSLIASGSCNTTATNMVMRNSTGADVLSMPGYDTNPWVMWVDSLPAYSYTNYLLYTAESTGGEMRYFPGTGGMATDDNDASLELGNNFQIEIKGFIDTSAGADKNLVFKDAAIKIYISAAGSITVAFSEAGAPSEATFYSTASDGIVSYIDANHATAHDAANGEAKDTTTDLVAHNSLLGGEYYVYRAFLYFTVPAEVVANKIDATLSLHGVAGGYENDLDHPDLGIVEGIQDDPLALDDFGDHLPKTTLGADSYYSYDTWNEAGYNAKALNATGLGWIAEATKFCLRTKGDIDDAVPTAGNRIVSYSNEDGAGKLPKLVVNYTTYQFNDKVTATGISSGVRRVVVEADGVDLTISVYDEDDNLIDDGTVALDEASILNSDNNWAFLENDVMPYMNYHKIWVGGVLKQHIEWEYDDEFTDQSGNGNPATPTFRTTSSDVDVSGTVISFLPVSEAKAPSFTLGDTPPWITEEPAISGNFTTTIAPTFPGAGIITAIAEEADTPSQLPLTIIAGFIILAISLTVSGVTRRSGSNSLLLKSILIGGLMGIAIATLVFDFWMLLFFAIIAVALAMGSQQKGWV